MNVFDYAIPSEVNIFLVIFFSAIHEIFTYTGISTFIHLTFQYHYVICYRSDRVSNFNFQHYHCICNRKIKYPFSTSSQLLHGNTADSSVLFNFLLKFVFAFLNQFLLLKQISFTSTAIKRFYKPLISYYTNILINTFNVLAGINDSSFFSLIFARNQNLRKKGKLSRYFIIYSNT